MPFDKELAEGEYANLTTIGRRSGLPREIRSKYRTSRSALEGRRRNGLPVVVRV